MPLYRPDLNKKHIPGKHREEQEGLERSSKGSWAGSFKCFFLDPSLDFERVRGGSALPTAPGVLGFGANARAYQFENQFEEAKPV